MVPAKGEKQPDCFLLFGVEVIDHFRWELLPVAAHLFHKIAVLVVAELYASDEVPAAVMKKMFDWAATILINRSNSRRSGRSVAGIRTIHSDDRAAITGRQVRIDVHDFRFSPAGFVRVRLGDSLPTFLIRRDHLRDSSRRVIFKNLANRYRSALLNTHDG